GYTSGRVNTVLIDETDATGNTVLTGGVTGGIWRCTNFLSGSIPNWTPVNDFLSNMNIVWLCQDPTNLNTMYAATGEAFNNSGAVRGNGLFKSSDRGLTWVQLTSTAGITRSFKVECDASGNVYYATAGSGLLRSSNGGNSWTTITPSSTSTTCVDFELTSTGALHASFGFFGTAVYYRYTTNPSTVTSGTWLRGNGIRASATSTNRMDLAAVGDVVYAITVNASYKVDSCYKSSDGGANWTLTNATTNYPTGIANGQGWKNIILEINPNNTDEIIMGGLDAYRSSNSGNTVTRITYWVTSSPYVHADHHFFKWYNAGAETRMIMGGDGGIFYSNDNATSFIDKNRNLNIKQFYSCAIHPTEPNYFLAG
ncbi:MAG: WD40/YVTN/BNR-like repeat-containing protein, partial [Dolichospermum sp.]